MEQQKTVTATLRHLHIAPRKVRFVADVIRGLSVNEAEARLLLSPRRSGDPLLKLLRSALANARDRKISDENLFVQEIRVDEGPTIKRWMPRARGGVSSLLKRTSHITVVLGDQGKAPKTSFTIVRREPTAKAERGRKKEEKHESSRDTKAKTRDLHEHAPEKTGREQKGILQKVFRRKSI